MNFTRNVNVGILGHVDSGKTSLARALSTVVSTAGLDKHPQSQSRGITLDLGFSALRIEDAPQQVKEKVPEDAIGTQYTLVDCPGHASLIRTIIGGAQIIDAVLLVMDVTKGIEVQTAECLVIGEIIKDGKCPLLVVLNKLDLLPSSSREEAVEKMRKKITSTLNKTKFSGNFRIVEASACPGGRPGGADPPQGIEDIVQQMCCMIPVPTDRNPEGPLLFYVDHCFQVKGQGTILTGTVLQGNVAVGDTIELVEIGEQRKIKGMQMFKKPVKCASHGDRTALCVTHLDPTNLERLLVSTPGKVQRVVRMIARVERVRFFRSPAESYKKFHITLGHSTVLAEVMFFSKMSSTAQAQLHEDEFLFEAALGSSTQAGEDSQEIKEYFAMLFLDSPVPCPPMALLIGSRLDSTSQANSCRIAFSGTVLEGYPAAEAAAPMSLKVFKIKEKHGTIERWENNNEIAIVKGLFKKETDTSAFLGMRVTTADGMLGKIISTFGKSGKVKVSFPNVPLSPSPNSKTITLRFKKSVFATDKKHMFQ